MTSRIVTIWSGAQLEGVEYKISHVEINGSPFLSVKLRNFYGNLNLLQHKKVQDDINNIIKFFIWLTFLEKLNIKVIKPLTLGNPSCMLVKFKHEPMSHGKAIVSLSLAHSATMWLYNMNFIIHDNPCHIFEEKHNEDKDIYEDFSKPIENYLVHRSISHLLGDLVQMHNMMFFCIYIEFIDWAKNCLLLLLWLGTLVVYPWLVVLCDH
ncbi:hypothetical protein ACJX0J_015690 [Zea mays]